MTFEEDAQNFFKSNQEQILNIYNIEREKQGRGVLFISFLEDKIDVYYLKYEDLSEKIKNQCNIETKIYFYITKPSTKEEFIIKFNN
mgnify:CR=1 FL=1